MNKFIKFRRTHSIFHDRRLKLWGASVLVVLLMACGVKTNPVPPHFAPPPPVVNLTGNFDQGRVTLSWDVPLEGPPGAAVISGFRVMRARAAIKKEPCEDCLPLFVQVRDLALFPGVGKLPEGQAMGYSEKLDPGFKYQFKVVTYSENGVEGDDSNYVTFDYPAE